MSLKDYARSYLPQIEHEQPIIMGLSMGGMMAQEIVQEIDAQALILLSTFKQGDGLSPWFHLMKYVPLYRLSKGDFRLKTLPLWAPTVGIHKAEEQALLVDMFSKFDDGFRTWALEAILEWEPPVLDVPFVHIHGKKDHLFPASYIQHATFLKGTHFMIYQQAQEVSAEIQRFLLRY